MIKNDTRRDVSVGAEPVTSGFKVDVSRGQRIGRVSSEWFSRPDDERYLSLSTLHDAVRSRAERATARTVETKALRVEARTNDVSRLALAIPGCTELVAPTHWSFGQLCGLLGAPAGYLRQLPAPLAGINLQHGLASHRAEMAVDAADERHISAGSVWDPHDALASSTGADVTAAISRASRRVPSESGY